MSSFWVKFVFIWIIKIHPDEIPLFQRCTVPMSNKLRRIKLMTYSILAMMSDRPHNISSLPIILRKKRNLSVLILFSTGMKCF